MPEDDVVARVARRDHRAGYRVHAGRSSAGPGRWLVRPVPSRPAPRRSDDRGRIRATVGRHRADRGPRRRTRLHRHRGWANLAAWTTDSLSRSTLTLDELDWAADVVARHVPPTPQYSWPLLAEVAGSRVTVKHENHTPVGAFKVRGGLVYFERLVAESSAGARRGQRDTRQPRAEPRVRRWAHDRSVTIFVPHGNSVEKNAAMRGLGAEVIEFGHDFQEARGHFGRVCRHPRPRAGAAVPP